MSKSITTVTKKEKPVKDLATIEAEKREVDKKYLENVKKNVQKHSMEDYEFARAMIYDAIEKGQDLLEAAVTVAKETEAPRAIEVASMLIKSIVDSSKDLMKTQDQLLEISRKTEETNDLYTLPKGAKERQIEFGSGGGGSSAPLGEGEIQIRMTTQQLLELMDKEEKEYQSKNEPIDITPIEPT